MTTTYNNWFKEEQYLWQYDEHTRTAVLSMLKHLHVEMEPGKKAYYQRLAGIAAIERNNVAMSKRRKSFKFMFPKMRTA